jgi:Secretion system C-terminal sorting domain
MKSKYFLKYLIIILVLISFSLVAQINQKYSLGNLGAAGLSLAIHEGAIFTGGAVFISDSQGVIQTGYYARFDSSGIVLDSFYVGFPGQEYEVNKLFFDDSFNIYLLGNYSRDSSLNFIGGGVYVQKRDSNNQIIWTTEFVDTFPYNGLIVRDGELLENGNIAVVGTLVVCCDSIAPGVGESDFILFLFDQSGILLSKHRYGDDVSKEDVFCIEEGPNSLFLGGRKTNFFPRLTRTRIFEVDFSGNLIRSYLSPSFNSEGAFDIEYTSTNHVVYTGVENSTNGSFPQYKPVVVKLDSTLSQEWIFISSDSFESVARSNCIEEDAQGNYLIAGNRLGLINDTLGIYGFLQSISPQKDSLWLRNFRILSGGNQQWHDFRDLVVEDGKSYITGQTQDLGKPLPPQNEMWLVQVDSLGCLVPGCQINGLSDELQERFISVYPNPADSKLNIRFEFELNSPATYNIYDMKGTLQDQDVLDPNRFEIDVSDFPHGMYFLKVSHKERMIGVKFLKN